MTRTLDLPLETLRLQQDDRVLTARCITEPDRLLAETQTAAARLAQRAPVAVASVKRPVYFATSRQLGRGLDYELAGFLAAGSTRAMKRTIAASGEDLDRHGDTPFLANPKPWIDGTRVDQVS